MDEVDWLKRQERGKSEGVGSVEKKDYILLSIDIDIYDKIRLNEISFVSQHLYE